MSRHRRGLAATLLAGAVLAGAVLAGCSGPPPRAAVTSSATGPRALTDTEADRLAVTRFLAYQATGTAFRTTVVSGTTPVQLVGDLDFRDGVGTATVGTAGRAAFVFQWNARALLAFPVAGGTTLRAPLTPPGTAHARTLNPGGNDVDALLAVLLALGQDRPDNPQLIQRNGARWLRSATLDGQPVDVVAGPTSRRGAAGSGQALVYWIDRRGHLLRLDAHLGGGAATTRVELDAAGYRAFRDRAALYR